MRAGMITEHVCILCPLPMCGLGKAGEYHIFGIYHGKGKVHFILYFSGPVSNLRGCIKCPSWCGGRSRTGAWPLSSQSVHVAENRGKGTCSINQQEHSPGGQTAA